ncbi:IS3 family transposase [Glycomyces luteolus]|uniref:IS3 family transposase n=1 Tax=Glycomyces luteolus TaxID=2670330 RepID=UPI002FD7B316
MTPLPGADQRERRSRRLRRRDSRGEPEAARRERAAPARARHPAQGREVFRGRDELVSRFQFVDEYRHEFSVKRLCETLGVSRQGYYQWQGRAPARAAKAASDAAATSRIKAAHEASRGVYGSPRITVELRSAGEAVNRKRVARLMRRARIEGVRLRKRRSAPASEPAGQVVPDRLGRDFTAPESNRRYVGDITYLPLEGGSFLYLATVLDLHSRRLAGWAIADHQRADLVETAPRRAHFVRGSISGAIFHADHGTQYVSAQFAQACKDLGVLQSRAAVGSSADNALAESFNATLKREVLQGRRTFVSALEARFQVESWIGDYNTTRRHSSLGYASPIDYEHQRANLARAA